MVKEDDQVLSLKVETVKWILALICSLLVYAVVAAIVQNGYHPDINSLIEAADNKFFVPGLAHPKPVESLLFKLGVRL